MKLHTLVGLLSLSLGLAACEKEGEQPVEQPATPGATAEAPKPGAPAEAPKPAEPTVTEICNQLTAAAKANDDAKLSSLASGDLAAEGVKEHIVTGLAGGSCGEGKVEGDKATVPLTQGEGKTATTKELPFIKADGGWKLDAAAYTSKYPAEGAKGKKAKGGKAKGKKGKKGK